MKVPNLAVALAVLGLVVLSVLVITQGVVLLDRKWQMAWQLVPDWIAAFGGVSTIGALIVAWMLYRHDVQTRAADDEHRAQSERRRQADLLTAWFVHFGTSRYAPVVQLNMATISADTIFSNVPDTPRVLVTSCQLGLINASQVVIYDLVVAAVCGHHVVDSIALPEGESNVPWDEDRDQVALGRLNVLQPGQWTADLRLSTISVVPRQLHLFFRDHQGVYWWRNEKGTLVEQPAPQPGSQEHDTSVSRYEQISAALGHRADGARAQYLTIRQLEDKAV